MRSGYTRSASVTLICFLSQVPFNAKADSCTSQSSWRQEATATNNIFGPFKRSNTSSNCANTFEHELAARYNKSTINGIQVSQLQSDIEATNEELETGVNYMSAEQLDLTDLLFNGKPEQQNGMSQSEYTHALVKVKLVLQPNSEYFIHKYDSQSDIQRAAGPLVDQERCLQELEFLVTRAREHIELGTRSRDINFVHYADTFAGSPRGFSAGGQLQWLGSYDACRRLQISTGNNTTAAGKYCIGSFRYKDWTSENFVDELLSLRMAVCLPESCDSLNYGNKFELIKQLNDYTGARQLDHSSSMELSLLYCAPDEGSELGTWWRSRPTLITVALTLLWITVLLIATYRDEKKKRINEHLRSQVVQNLQVSAGFGPVPMPAEVRTSQMDKLCQSLSIVNNTKQLLNCRPPRLPPTAKGFVVDLDLLDGIRVPAAMYIMSGHVLIMALSTMGNARELSDSRALTLVLINLMPAFAVNAFFVITGILTAYLMFSKNQMKSFTANPAKWLAVILSRYVRLVPMYALVTLFCKHVARYIGDGPLWDYGTSSLAARRNCQQEPWLWTLLLAANFKPPMRLCIPPGWYLANDFQFVLLTPLLLTALYLRPKWGKRLLLVLVGAGYLAGVWTILAAKSTDYSIITKFSPHAFMVYVSYVGNSYTQPQYRIPAYLVGLLLGHKLHEHEQEQRRKRSDMACGDSTNDQHGGNCWPVVFKHGHLFSLLIVVLAILTPSIASRIPWSAETSQLAFAVYMATCHLVYMLLATTGNGFGWFNENFLKLAIWRPLSRLGLCVMLVNMEVIAFLTQTSRANLLIDNYNLTSLCVMSFIYSYLFAALAHVLFELPIEACRSRLANLLLRTTIVWRSKQVPVSREKQVDHQTTR